jgi:hypothetical protein
MNLIGKFVDLVSFNIESTDFDRKGLIRPAIDNDL